MNNHALDSGNLSTLPNPYQPRREPAIWRHEGIHSISAQIIHYKYHSSDKNFMVYHHYTPKGTNNNQYDDCDGDNDDHNTVSGP